jgi:hypothetical protein
MRKNLPFFLLLIVILASCNFPVLKSAPRPASLSSTGTPQSLPDMTVLPSPSPSLSPTISSTLIPSVTASLTSTITNTVTETATSGPSATPTFTFPTVIVNQQAHCRYGPNVAYLHAADLYAGDSGSVRGRFVYSKWLLVKFDKLRYFCWVAPSVVDVVGDLNKIKFTEPILPGPSVLYTAPHGVKAERQDEKVTISWEPVAMTTDDDRGYFLDLFVCQGGSYLWFPVALANQDKTSYTVKDEAGCPMPSSGKIYTVEKHGYTNPVTINWPEP